MNLIERYLDQLTRELSIDISPKDSQGFVKLSINKSLSFWVKHLDPGFYLYAQLTSCPKEKKELFFSFLMRANYLNQGTLGSTLALDPTEKFLTLAFSMPYEVDYRGFKERVEDFANMVDFWRGEIRRLEDEARKESIFS